MADDIVTRLRRVGEQFRYNTPDALAAHINDAADEIERLRAAGDALVAAIRAHDLTEERIKAWEEACRG